jgi:4-amino-4-deoxychorismate lyase
MLIDGLTTELVKADDRGLAYGDGLFETIRVHQGRLLFLEEHLERLLRGCRVLHLEANFSQIETWLQEKAARVDGDAVIKLILTRGSGGRGYRPPEHPRSRCIISTHALPANTGFDVLSGVKAFVCKQTLAHQGVLAGLKHLNRLEQVLASMEFPDPGYFEGLMCDAEGLVIEGTRSNVFVSHRGCWLTPELERCGVEGVLRRKLLQHFGMDMQVANIPLATLWEADEIIIANSVLGVWPLCHLEQGSEYTGFKPGALAAAATDYFNKALRTC